MDLARFEQLVEDRADEWASLGIVHEFHYPSDEELERAKTAAWVVIETELAGGQLIVWDSGEAELSLIYKLDGASRDVHYDLSDDSLGDCISELTGLLLARPAEELLHRRPISN